MLEFIPQESNILIFHASRNPKAAQNFENFFLSNSNLRQVEVQHNWWLKFEMNRTRIYFLGAKNEEIAHRLANKLPGIQSVIDYYNQNTMVNINPDRDIVIFVGNDLSNI